MTKFAPAFYSPNLFRVFRRVGSVWDLLYGSLFAWLLAFAGSRRVLVSGRWRFLCFSEQSNFLETVCFREARFERFSLRCSHCADVGFFVGLSFVDRACRSSAFLLVFDSASAFSWRDARDNRTALRSLLLAPLVSMRTRALQADRFSIRRRGAGSTPQSTGNELVARRDPTP